MTTAVHELEKRLIQPSSPADRLDALLALAVHHAAGFRNREGLRAAREALSLARARGDCLSVGRALAAATQCHHQRGDYVAAVASGLDAVEAYAEGDLLGRSSALQSIALALFSVEAFDLAERMAERSLEDAVAAGDAEREAGARGVLGVILADRRAFNAARRQFRAAGAFHRVAGDRLRLKKAAANLGHTYRKQGNAAEADGRLPLARIYWRQALRVYRVALATGRADADDAIILGAMAESECRLGEIDAAYADAAKALDLAVGTASPRILAPCYLWESHALKAMGRLDAAERACARARAAAECLEQDNILTECLRAQASLHDLQGRFQKAADVEEQARQRSLDRELLLAGVREQLIALLGRREQGVARNVVRLHSNA